MPDKKKILIIDDEVDLCLLLKNYFVRKSYEVLVTHTLNEGKLLLSELRPDILFLDNNLPDGTGWELAPSFSADFPDMQIVLISAFHPTLPQMPEHSKFIVIEKPVGFADLDAHFSEL